MAVDVKPLIRYSTARKGAAVLVFEGDCLGGMIANPSTALDQGQDVPQTLYVDMVFPAVTRNQNTTFAVQPGQSFTLPGAFSGALTVTSLEDEHAFSGYILHSLSSYTPLEAVGETGMPFPPTTITTLHEAMRAYLYQQYSDDDDLQAFVAAFNEIVGWYADWFAYLNPADYTQDHIRGVFLEWIAAGLYGVFRPVLPMGFYTTLGPLNTWMFNTIALNDLNVIAPPEVWYIDDDVLKRIMTWHLYKADGDIFNIRWLKRRIKRFLSGADGKGGQTDTTYEVSVTIGAGRTVTIDITAPESDKAAIFKAAAEAGVLELPFQYTFTVIIH